MKNDTAFVRMHRSGDLGDAKCRKKALCFVEFNFFTNHNRQNRVLQNERGRAGQQKQPQNFYFSPGD